MRNEIVVVIDRIMKSKPELKFCQLLSSAINIVGLGDLITFYISDDEMLKALLKYESGISDESV